MEIQIFTPNLDILIQDIEYHHIYLVSPTMNYIVIKRY